MRRRRRTKTKRESQEVVAKIKYIVHTLQYIHTEKEKKDFREKDRFQICLNTAKHRRTKYIHYPAAEYRVKKGT